MVYQVKECFLTLQGEGARTGRVALFCRMTGCNLWSGKPQDRTSALCSFCDTDFLGTDGPGGGTFATAALLTTHMREIWRKRCGGSSGVPYVVFTGGEPLLQLDAVLVDACRDRGFEVAVETNGTLPCPEQVDWIAVSPKSLDRLVLLKGNELKLVHPQPGLGPELFDRLEFEHFFVQPMDGPRREENTRLCVEFCLSHPRWRLSLQSHKLIGIP